MKRLEGSIRRLFLGRMGFDFKKQQLAPGGISVYERSSGYDALSNSLSQIMFILAQLIPDSHIRLE